MTGSKTRKSPSGAALTAIALSAALLLGGCGRDTDASEKLAAANAAALRAENAAKRAEEALAKIEKVNQPPVVDADPDATEDAADAAVAEDDVPVDPAPDVKS